MTNKEIQNKLGELGYGVAANKYPLNTQELIIKHNITKDELKQACSDTFGSYKDEEYDCLMFYVDRDDKGVYIMFLFDDDELAKDNDFDDYIQMSAYSDRRNIIESALYSMRLALGIENKQ